MAGGIEGDAQQLVDEKALRARQFAAAAGGGDNAAVQFGLSAIEGGGEDPGDAAPAVFGGGSRNRGLQFRLYLTAIDDQPTFADMAVELHHGAQSSARTSTPATAAAGCARSIFSPGADSSLQKPAFACVTAKQPYRLRSGVKREWNGPV